MEKHRFYSEKLQENSTNLLYESNFKKIHLIYSKN